MKEIEVRAAIISDVTTYINSLPPTLQKPATTIFEKVLLTDEVHGHEITLLPFRMAVALKKAPLLKEDSAYARLYGTIGVYGWMSYTIYDKIIDNEIATEYLALANIFNRKMIGLYVTETNPTIVKLCQDILTKIDHAHYIEKTVHRIPVHLHILDTSKEIEAPDDEIIYGKSFGQALPCLAIVTTLSTTTPESSENILLKQHLEKFFRNYILARQLSDDIRDWWQDLSKGIITQVSACIISAWEEKVPGTIHIKNDEAKLRELFYLECLPDLSKKIVDCCTKAKNSLKNMKKISALKDTSFLETLIEPYEYAAKNALEKL